jgi:hypothetical protein
MLICANCRYFERKKNDVNGICFFLGIKVVLWNEYCNNFRINLEIRK